MSTRLLSIGDLAQLIVLDTATNPHPWTATQWQDSLLQHLCIGLEYCGLISGFVVLMLLPDEAELLLIAVNPGQQGCGQGRELLMATARELKSHNLSRIILEVRESNQTARRFYSAAGFKEAGRRKAYYPCAQGREDALIYDCDLSEMTL